MMKRIKANDPAAMCQMGGRCSDEGDYDSAFEYWTKAAELGNAVAHYQLGIMYEDGEGVEKDEEKAVFHFEKAAICGHPRARYNLACYEGGNGNAIRAARHLIIAANLGDEYSMKALWGAFKHGDITKDDLDATLRSHQDALNAMKSAQRDAADVALHGLR
jgi:TPR repeat protein